MHTCWGRVAEVVRRHNIAYFTELNLQIIYVQKRRIRRKNSKYVPDENLYAHFCSCWQASNFCQPTIPKSDHSSVLCASWSLQCVISIPLSSYRFRKKSILSRWNIVFANSFKSWRKKRPLRQTYTVLHRGFLWKEPSLGTNIPQIINQNVKLKNPYNGIFQAPGIVKAMLAI